MISGVDANNLLVFLNRVETTGIDEAKILAVLAHKLERIKEEDGNDVPGSDEPSAEEAGRAGD